MTTEELQAQKLQLEIDKLNNDIEKSNTSFLKTSDFWKSIIPTFLTTGGLLATLYFTVGRSFIDDEKRKLELQKEQLKLEIMKFDDVKLSIQKDIIESTIDKNTLLTRIKTLQNQNNALDKKFALLNNSIKVAEVKNTFLKNKNKLMQLTYTKDTSFYKTQLREEYKTSLNQPSEADYFMLIGRKDIKIAELNAETEYYKSKVELSPLERKNLDVIILKAKLSVSEKLANESKNKADNTGRRLTDLEEFLRNLTNYDQMTLEELQHTYELFSLRGESSFLPAIQKMINNKKAKKSLGNKLK